MVSLPKGGSSQAEMMDSSWANRFPLSLLQLEIGEEERNRWCGADVDILERSRWPREPGTDSGGVQRAGQELPQILVPLHLLVSEDQAHWGDFYEPPLPQM